MLYALIGTDKPGHLETRLGNRPAHLEYLQSLGHALKAAGPFMGPDDKPCGSLVIFEAQSLEAAQAVANNDPYAKAGLFSATEIRPWKWLIKNPEA